VRAANAVASKRHSNVEPVSFDENVKVAVVDDTVPDGAESIVVFGGVGSPGGVVMIVQVRAAGVWSVLPAASFARTSKV